MTFLNKRFLTRQYFDIQKSSLKISRKKSFDAIEYEVPFEIINNRMKVQKIVNNNLIYTGVFFFLFSLLFQIGPNDELTLIFMVIGLVFIIAPFINRKKVITLLTMDGVNIELYYNNQNKADVMEYAKEIIAASDNFLFKKYSKLDRLLPIEPQLEGLQYLLHREIISDEIFESFKNQLLGQENKSAIGFANK
jgi:hypothetical protein